MPSFFSVIFAILFSQTNSHSSPEAIEHLHISLNHLLLTSLASSVYISTRYSIATLFDGVEMVFSKSVRRSSQVPGLTLQEFFNGKEKD